MVNRSEPANAARSSLSSLMDGDLAPGAVADACRAWRDDAEARDCWHTYHLIGDVLRAEDLAVSPARDRDFLQALRTRLADEPVPMAPAPLAAGLADEPPAAAAPWLQVANGAAVAQATSAPPRRGLGWLVAPAAVAAGFVAVAGVMVVLRSGAPSGTEPGAGPTLAQNPSAPGAVVPVSVLRDTRLDRYLDAHRSLASGVAATGSDTQRVHIVLETK